MIKKNALTEILSALNVSSSEEALIEIEKLKSSKETLEEITDELNTDISSVALKVNSIVNSNSELELEIEDLIKFKNATISFIEELSSTIYDSNTDMKKFLKEHG
jgi:hypothetical protein